MTYLSDYTFTHPIKDGKYTKYFQVLKALYNAEKCSLSKKDILGIVWPNRGKVVDRGYVSNTFAQLSSANLIKYDPVSRKIGLTEQGIRYVVVVIYSQTF